MASQRDPTESPVWKVAVAASLGTFFDYYDVFLAATAASLVWPTVFFAGLGTRMAIALSLGAFGLNFVVRPLGAAIFGHYGDRLGRKRVLSWTLLVSALGTAGIALLPSSASIGLLAPVILYALRLIYGLGLGGEWGGAVSWLVEAAPKSRKRGLLAGFVQVVQPLAGVVSSLSFVAILLLPYSEFLAWGWRILFIIGSLIAVVGFVTRARLAETPMFRELQASKGVTRSPVAESIRKFGGRIAKSVGSILYLYTFFAFFSVPYALTYMMASGLSPEESNLLFTGSLVVGVIACLAGSALSDRFGRKRVIAASAILSVASTYPWISLVSTGSYLSVLVGLSLLTAAGQMGNGAIGAFLAEGFPSSSRYTSSGIAYNMAGTLGGVFSGFVLPVLIGTYGVANATFPGAIICGVAALGSLGSLMLVKETKRTKLTLNADPYGRGAQTTA